MKEPPSDLHPLLITAMELRAVGSSWEVVGAEVHRSSETCRKWPLEYARFWNAHYLEAEYRAITDCAAEALLVLRKVMRSPQESLRSQASRFFLSLRNKLHTLQERMRSLEQKSRDSMAEYIADLDAHSDGETPVHEHAALKPALELRDLKEKAGMT